MTAAAVVAQRVAEIRDHAAVGVSFLWGLRMLVEDLEASHLGTLIYIHTHIYIYRDCFGGVVIKKVRLTGFQWISFHFCLRVSASTEACSLLSGKLT